MTKITAEEKIGEIKKKVFRTFDVGHYAITCEYIDQAFNIGMVNGIKLAQDRIVKEVNDITIEEKISH